MMRQFHTHQSNIIFQYKNIVSIHEYRWNKSGWSARLKKKKKRAFLRTREKERERGRRRIYCDENERHRDLHYTSLRTAWRAAFEFRDTIPFGCNVAPLFFLPRRKRARLANATRARTALHSMRRAPPGRIVFFMTLIYAVHAQALRHKCTWSYQAVSLLYQIYRATTIRKHSVYSCGSYAIFRDLCTREIHF